MVGILVFVGASVFASTIYRCGARHSHHCNLPDHIPSSIHSSCSFLLLIFLDPLSPSQQGVRTFNGLLEFFLTQKNTFDHVPRHGEGRVICLYSGWTTILDTMVSPTLRNAARAREMARPLTPGEERRIKEGIPKETVVKESFWRMRPDGIAVLPPVGNTTGTFCILEHKRMSDVCERYLVRAKSTTENQYVSLRRAISTVIQRQGWKVEQISFITGVRSVDKQDLNKNLKFFRVPEASINFIYSKLVMRVFDVYTNTLKCMYRIRFRGGTTRSEASSDAQPTPSVVTSLTFIHYYLQCILSL